jgi:tRNA dimethylallyltransferase
MDKLSKIILISGPTGSGKSNFAVKIAKKINGEIINADSMQVYKQFKILTARPSLKNQKDIKHHLYGFIDFNKKFSTGKWLKEVLKKINQIKNKKKIPLIVGGTGLYFYSLINGLVKIPNIPVKIRNKVRLIQKKNGQKKFYQKLLKLDSKIQNKFDPNDSQRTIRAFEIKTFTKLSMYDWLDKTQSDFDENDFIKYYINFERSDLIKRIEKRVDQMIKHGELKEVKMFNKLKIKKDHTINKIIGINELNQYLNKEITLSEAKKLIVIKTRQYAKRQSTWARGRMSTWSYISPSKFSSEIKKLPKILI